MSERARYDQFGFAGVDPNYAASQGGAGGFGGFGGVDLGDIFGDIFGGGFGGFGGGARANPNAPRKGQDIRVRITLSFDEAVHGCKKNITITRQQTCAECGGSGAAPGSQPESCPDCGGRGYVIQQQRTPFGVMQSQQPCTRCGGKGKIIKNPCKVCHGSGKVATKKTLEVSIPMGIDDDQSFALRGMGDAGANGGPAGDVIVMVTVRPDELFQRDGYDVWVTIPITFSQAVLGDKITVPTIDGKVEYDLPEGTQSGTTFRLRGKGIQYLNGRGRGDMYVKCDVEIPKKLNKTQREALKKFEGTLKDDNYEKRKGFFRKLKDILNTSKYRKTPEAKTASGVFHPSPARRKAPCHLSRRERQDTPAGVGQAVVRHTCPQLCLTAKSPRFDAGSLAPPRGELSQGAQVPCD